MSLLSVLIRKGAQLGALADQSHVHPVHLQQKQLLHQLRKAAQTDFGRYYGFTGMLLSRDPQSRFRREVPAVDYNRMYERWWSAAHLCDSPNVCWPGRVPYFALSSGTSQASTKYIPVTDDMIRGMKRGTRRLFCDLSTIGTLPKDVFKRQMLAIGSCTSIKKEGLHRTGDLSGIIGLNRPLWMERYYRPGRAVTDLPEWSERIERIAEEAPKWDIGFVVGNPMWVQLVFERILEWHGASTIHDIWENLSVFVHGGVFCEPYKPSLDRLFAQEVQYIDSYMASEGFFGYQDDENNRDLRLLPDCGIFYEFVPFNDHNFDENGDLRSEFPDTCTLEEVREGVQYATLLTTNAGAWRYLLGDTIQFTDLRRCAFRIAGRTKQYLSVCGEHLSIDNLNAAVQRAETLLGISIREFTVAGVRDGSGWAHEWFVGADTALVPADKLMQTLDEELCRLNDDYAIERRYALRQLRLQYVPNRLFLKWLEAKGKFNGQAKIPRVLKAGQLEAFSEFLRQNSAISGQ